MLLAGRESLSRVLMHGGRALITHVCACVCASIVVDLNVHIYISYQYISFKPNGVLHE